MVAVVALLDVVDSMILLLLQCHDAVDFLGNKGDNVLAAVAVG